MLVCPYSLAPGTKSDLTGEPANAPACRPDSFQCGASQSPSRSDRFEAGQLPSQEFVVVGAQDVYDLFAERRPPSVYAAPSPERCEAPSLPS